MPITSTANKGLPVHCFALKSKFGGETRGRRKPPPVLGKLEQGASSGKGKSEKATKSESSEDDSDDGNDGEKWKEERELLRDAAAARVPVLQKRVDSLEQELEIKKEYSASSLSSGSNASKCIVALKLTDAQKS